MHWTKTTTFAAATSLIGLAATAGAATIPFSQNFDTLGTGNTAVPNFTESNTAAMTIEADGAGKDYQASISGTSGAVNVSAAVQLTNAVGNAFSISTQMTVDAVSGSTGSTINSGLGLFSDQANFSSGSQYRLLFTSFSSSNTGKLTLTEHATSSGLTGTLTSGSSISGFVGKVLTLTANISYNASNHLLINASITDGTTTLNVSGTDTSPRSGQYFGYRTALNAVNGTASINVDYDEFSVVPEPASLGLMAMGGLLLGRRRR
jgi:hypothetical protein